MDPVIEKIIQTSNAEKKNSIKFLQQLLRIDTCAFDGGITGNEGNAREWLIKRLNEIGFRTELVEPDNSSISKYEGFTPGHNYSGRPSIIAVLEGKGGGRTVALNSHIDTMPTEKV